MNLHRWSLRARAMFARQHVERELDEELAFHIDREAQKLIDEGVPEADARVAARARFGSVPRAADECRDARGIGVIDKVQPAGELVARLAEEYQAARAEICG